jgi:peptidoglycan-associated lipoprotein
MVDDSAVIGDSRADVHSWLSKEGSVSGKSARNITQNNIYYEFDKSTLTPMAQDTLMRHAAWLRENADVTVTIEGHADERGTNEYNLALGDRRADSAKAFLVDLGIASSRLTTISYGEERPLCMQQSEECWAKNRRGHFVVN